MENYHPPLLWGVGPTGPEIPGGLKLTNSLNTYNVGMIEFDWDLPQVKSNKKRHGVTFEEAQSVFYDDYAAQFYDQSLSNEEDRFLLLGMSNRSRLLLIVHCEKGDGDVILIISTRKAFTTESTYYTGPKS